MKYEVIYFIQIISASLSARRVWIEIIKKERRLSRQSSLSARRVWIEISVKMYKGRGSSVTLREEGVD